MHNGFAATIYRKCFVYIVFAVLLTFLVLCQTAGVHLFLLLFSLLNYLNLPCLYVHFNT